MSTPQEVERITGVPYDFILELLEDDEDEYYDDGYEYDEYYELGGEG